MTRHLITSVTLITFVIGSQPTLEAQQGRGSVSSARGSASHSGNTGSVQGQRASGTRTVEQTGSGGTATRQAQTQSGASRSTTREVDTANQQVDKTTTTTTAWGESGTRSRQVEGQGGYADRPGQRKHQHRTFGLRRRRGGPQLCRAAGSSRIGQHQIQRHLQRRRSAHAVWRVEHRRGRPVRRARDDDAAIRLPDLDILRSPLLLLRRVLPALHLWRRSLLLSGSATGRRGPQSPSSGPPFSSSPASLTWCRRTAATASRRKPATERRATSPCPRHRAPPWRCCRRRACS